MSWDKTKPADTESIRLGASRIRELKAALEIAADYEFTFPGADGDNPKLYYTPLHDTTANRPAAAAGTAGRLYVNTTTKTIQRDNGVTFDDLTPPTNILPAGVILPYGANLGSVPSGFLYCNGQAVSRTTYATLFAVLGTSWGQGDGSTTFNVPDLRGVVLRGRNDSASDAWKDPDSATRTTRLTGGASGDNVGSVQLDDYLSHTHTIDAASGADGNSGGPSNNVSGLRASGASPTSGGAETRMRNASVSYMIKY